MAGNNKDNPAEISRLLGPICDGACDLVVGSRYLAGGRYGGDMPVYRKVATRIHPWLFSLAAGKKLTETTNGFRALRLSCLDDPRINLQQGWLDGYALEVYLLYKMITLGYRHVEVPCTKIYPPKNLGYTKMTPLVGWWDILQPVFLLGLRIKDAIISLSDSGDVISDGLFMITVNCIGLGHWGPNLVRCFDSNDRARVGTVCDLSDTRLALLRKRFSHKLRTSTDPFATTVDPKADAVVIATPTQTHFDLVRAALLRRQARVRREATRGQPRRCRGAGRPRE